MTHQIETLSTLERRLTVTFSTDTLKEEVQARLKKLCRTAKIQGFRPGKAPLKIVEQNYGAQVYEEALGTEVQRRFSEAIAAEKLNVAGFPRFEPAKEQANAGEFTFSAVFEVYPEIELQDLSSREIEKPLLTVQDSDVEKTIEVLRRQRTRFNRVERAAQNEDRVIIDFVGKIDGEAFEGGTSENFPFVLGQKQMLPEFEAGVLGLKENESRDVTVNFPEDYHGKDVAGKTAIFSITVKNVAEPQLPELNEEFAKTLGIQGSVDQLKAEVRKNVELEAKRRLSAKTKENVIQALLETHQFDVPKALIQMEVGRLMDQARQDLKQRGMDPKNMPLPADIFLPQAERRVKVGLLLNALLEKYEVKISKDDEKVRALVREYASSYENPEEVEAWYYASPERIDGPLSLVIEETLVERILADAKVNEKTVSFDELMGNQ